MPAKRIPSDGEIEAYRNVPVEVASAYLDWSAQAIRWALSEGRAPFGSAVKGKSSWTYHISPGALIRYQRGELPAAPSIKELQAIIADGVLDLVNAITERLSRVLEAVVQS